VKLRDRALAATTGGWPESTSTRPAELVVSGRPLAELRDEPAAIRPTGEEGPRQAAAE